MRIFTAIVAIILATFIALQPQVISMRAEYDTNAHTYYMVITGDQAEIDRICAQGDCSRTFATRLEATNYFLDILGRAYGITLVPIPPPLTGA